MKTQNDKKGITITSLVIYVILLFSIITLVVIITGGFNERMFEDRGMAININNVNKLQYNIFHSASKSNKASIINSKLCFSNGDIYSYDSERQILYKNQSPLLENTKEFIVNTHLSPEGTKISISLVLKKYLSEIDREIIVFVED